MHNVYILQHLEIYKIINLFLFRRSSYQLVIFLKNKHISSKKHPIHFEQLFENLQNSIKVEANCIPQNSL